MAKNITEKLVFPTIDSCNTCISSFDLWMSQGGVDIFVLIFHFLNDKWEPCHVTIGFFETTNTFGSSMAL
jgi:hypothetical protein